MPEEKEKFCIESIVTIGDKTAALGYDLNTVEELTERRLDRCFRALIPSLARFVRDEGKIVNPCVWD